MTARSSTHSIRALAIAVALLLAAPLAAAAQETTSTEPLPQPTQAPQGLTTPGGVSAPSGLSSTTSAVIHSGDQLQISVYGDQSLTQTAVVQADGTIQYPLVGRVLVGGLTSAEARDALAKSLQKYVRHPIVSLAVQQQGSMNVLVLGNVKTSGRFTLRSGSRLSDAVAAAGGVASFNGDYPPARVSSDGATTTVSLQKLLHDGDVTQNAELADNAIIYVTGADTIRVQVLGAVSRPGNVEVNEGDRLSMALARAGAEASVKPDLNRVYLTRVDPTTGKTLPSYQIDLYRALQQGDQRYDPILRKDDKIYVPEAHQISAGTIGVLSIFGRLLGF